MRSSSACAADEPIVTGKRAKKATPTLTRRVKQAVAEWYVLHMLEPSWDGFVEHTQRGWNTGKPPYGYMAEKVAHPVPVDDHVFPRLVGHVVPHLVDGQVAVLRGRR